MPQTQKRKSRRAVPGIRPDMENTDPDYVNAMHQALARTAPGRKALETIKKSPPKPPMPYEDFDDEEEFWV